MIKKVSKVILSVILIAMIFTVIPLDSVHAQAPTTLKIGSKNGDVWDLQFRLQELGYGIGIDGVYGYNTFNAVKQFQRNYGLISDGIVGPTSWSVLKKVSLSKNELNLLTKLVYSEARGESYKGQVAVAAVVINRIQDANFPNNLRSVIFQKDAFTAVSDGQFWLNPNGTAKNAALDAIRGWDPSKGALFYFNPKTATSSWIWSRPSIITIGSHIFTK